MGIVLFINPPHTEPDMTTATLPLTTRPTPPEGTTWTLSAGGKDEQGRRFREFSATYTSGWRTGLTAKDAEGNWVRFVELL